MRLSWACIIARTKNFAEQSSGGATGLLGLSDAWSGCMVDAMSERASSGVNQKSKHSRDIDGNDYGMPADSPRTIVSVSVMVLIVNVRAVLDTIMQLSTRPSLSSTMDMRKSAV